MPFILFFIFIGTTLEEKNMLPIGSIFFSLKQPLLRRGFLDLKRCSEMVHRYRFHHTKDEYFLLFIVLLNLILYFTVSYFVNKDIRQIYVSYSTHYVSVV